MDQFWDQRYLRYKEDNPGVPAWHMDEILMKWAQHFNVNQKFACMAISVLSEN